MSDERPAPESEDDLEVPGQPYLGLLGILSEYYRIREPDHKQGQTLTAALKYLYRVKQRTPNGFDEDEDFGLEMMNAVAEVTKKIDDTKPEENTTEAEPSKSPTPSFAFPNEDEKEKSDKDDFDLDDFGFSDSEKSSEDDFSSKIDSLVKMVKNTVKKKKRKKHKRSPDQNIKHSMANILGMEGMDDEPCIPKLKIRFGPRSPSASETSSGGEGNTSLNKDSPMKLKIKLGAATPPPKKPSPLLPPPTNLPPPPSLMPAPPLLHKPSTITIPSSTPPSLQSYSPKYEAEEQSKAPLQPPKTTSPPLEIITCSDNDEDKPPIKLTLRVHQPLRRARATISPRTEQLVNYIDDVTTFLNENDIPSEDLRASEEKLPEVLPGPPKLKMAPSITRENCRKRKREISPKHEAEKPTPRSVIAEDRKAEKIKTVPPLKFCMNKSKNVTNSNHKEKSTKLKLMLSNNKSAPNSPVQIKLSPQSHKEQDCGTPKNVSSTPKSVSSTPKSVSSTPKNVSSTPKNVPSAPKNVSSAPKNVSSAPKNVPSTPKNVPSAPKVNAEKSKGIWKYSKFNKVIAEREYWLCGVFSNSLKLNEGQVDDEQCDLRSNILPNYCGITYLRKKREFLLPYDIWWAKKNDALAPRLPAPKSPVTKLVDLLKGVKSVKPTTPKCSELVFDKHMGDSQSKRNKTKDQTPKQNQNSTTKSTPKSNKSAVRTSAQPTPKTNKEAKKIPKLEVPKIALKQAHNTANKTPPLEIPEEFRIAAAETLASIMDALDTTSGSSNTSLGSNTTHITIAEANFDESTCSKELATITSCTKDNSVTITIIPEILVPNQQSKETENITDPVITQAEAQETSSPMDASNSQESGLVESDDMDIEMPEPRLQASPDSIRDDISESPDLIIESDCDSPIPLQEQTSLEEFLKFSPKETSISREECDSNSPELVPDCMDKRSLIAVMGLTSQASPEGSDEVFDENDNLVVDDQDQVEPLSIAGFSQDDLQESFRDGANLVVDNEGPVQASSQERTSAESVSAGSAEVVTDDVSTDQQSVICPEQGETVSAVGAVQGKDSLSTPNSTEDTVTLKSQLNPLDVLSTGQMEEYLNMSQQTVLTDTPVMECSNIPLEASPIKAEELPKASTEVDLPSPENTTSTFIVVVEPPVNLDQACAEKTSVDAPDHIQEHRPRSEHDLVIISPKSADLEYESSSSADDAPRCVEFSSNSGGNTPRLEEDASGPARVSPLTPEQSPQGDDPEVVIINRVDPSLTLENDNIQQETEEELQSEESDISFSPSRILDDVLNEQMLGTESDISTPPAKRIKL